MATKSGLGALGSILEPSWGSWRLPKGSWRHLGALLAALGALLELPKGGEPTRGELEEDQAAARGGVGEGFTPLPLWLKGIKVYKDQRIEGLKGSKDTTHHSKRLRPKGSADY